MDLFSNGTLIRAAEETGFDLFLTNDTEIRYQQNLASRRIAIVVLTSSQWSAVRLMAEAIAAAMNSAGLGSFAESGIPLRPKPYR